MSSEQVSKAATGRPTVMTDRERFKLGYGLWTPEEDRLLGALRDETVAARLNRSVKSVKAIEQRTRFVG